MHYFTRIPNIPEIVQTDVHDDLIELRPVVMEDGDLGRQLAKQRRVQTLVLGIARERNSCAIAMAGLPAGSILERGQDG